MGLSQLSLAILRSGGSSNLPAQIFQDINQNTKFTLPLKEKDYPYLIGDSIDSKPIVIKKPKRSNDYLKETPPEDTEELVSKDENSEENLDSNSTLEPFGSEDGIFLLSPPTTPPLFFNFHHDQEKQNSFEKDDRNSPRQLSPKANVNYLGLNVNEMCLLEKEKDIKQENIIQKELEREEEVVQVQMQVKLVESQNNLLKEQQQQQQQQQQEQQQQQQQQQQETSQTEAHNHGQCFACKKKTKNNQSCCRTVSKTANRRLCRCGFFLCATHP